MKNFIIKTFLLSIFVALSFFIILSFADGNTDDFYMRFATPKQESLIIGSSRSAQGLIPEVLNENIDTKLFNFSFTIAQSPYGKTYLNSIKNKLKESTLSGVFILSVDPWSISSMITNPNDSTKFRELNLCLGNTLNVSSNPNFGYLINNLKGKYWQIPVRKFVESTSFLHEDGWLEITCNMDSIIVQERIESKTKSYKSNIDLYQYSSLRLDYLKKTINYLNEYGNVYLVRLPIHPEIMKIENIFMPEFNSLMKDIIPLTSGYLDMTDMNDKFTYTDGNHLSKISAKIVSKEVALWIKNNFS